MPHYKPRIPTYGPSAKDRRCLRCSSTFLSHGAHNRICDPCHDDAEAPQDFPYDPVLYASRKGPVSMFGQVSAEAMQP